MSDRRDLWIDGEHVSLTDEEYVRIREATGISPKELSVDEIEALLDAIPADEPETEPHPDAIEVILSSFDETRVPERVAEAGRPRKGTPAEPDDVEEEADGTDELDLARGDVQDHTEYWVLVYNTGSQRKGLHLPADESTFEDPVHRCDRPVDGEARLVSKPIAVFPFPAYEDRVCDNCREELAEELAERGDLRAD